MSNIHRENRSLDSNTAQRIVIVGPMYPYRGGIAHLSERIAMGFVARGYHVSAITFTRQYPNFLFPGKTQYEIQAFPDRAVEAERLIDSLNPFSWWKTAKRIREMDPDVVIFRYWLPFFAPAFGTIARLLSYWEIKSIAVVDNALPHERRLGDIALGRYFFRVINGCIVMSSSVGKDIDTMNLSCSKVYAPHPLYDSFGTPADPMEAREKLQLDHDAPVILFFGFIRKYKGLHILIDSIHEIKETLPDIQVLVAGEFYEDEASCKAQVKDLGISNQIRFFDHYIPKDDVADYFAAADVVVQPYLSATQSGVAQVAYHFEVPVITTDVGGLAEVVPHEKAGLIVPPHDSKALANAIKRYFLEEMQDRLTKGVQDQKRQFGWDRLLDAIETVM